MTTPQTIPGSAKPARVRPQVMTLTDKAAARVAAIMASKPGVIGLKIGINICFDGSFPESARILTLAGADLIVLPTNWADKAIKNATLVSRVRAFENHVYHHAVNRVGTERRLP